jgi:3-oxoadipate enol-lactonase
MHGGYRRTVPHVEVNGARLWVEESGSGPAVVFVHGGLGDRRLWEPQAWSLARRFRCIRYDLRFFGRSDAPGEAWSSIDDLVRLLDALEIDRAALVGLSMGGGLALDVAVAHPQRVWAVAHVAGSVTGLPANPYTDEQEAAFDAALERGDLDAAMAIDFSIWAPLGADETLRELWLTTPDARGIPTGAAPLPRPDVHERLGEIAVPALVVSASRDAGSVRDRCRTVAERIPGARLVEVDSDHYLTLREPERITRLLDDFLCSAAPLEE